mmetsp:Transcript_3272/g.7246  ORF Transcript_3272/g.7246 Transcript_3272/m.7246 type:complete len:257 (+) Transcript_3272:2149-2919(+)
MATSSQEHASNSIPPPHSSRNNVALGMIGGAFVGIMALTTPFVAMQLRSNLPYMETPRKKVERALKFISQRAASDKKIYSGHDTHPHESLRNNANLNFVDLGSGDGTAILAAASHGWNATGLELNPTLWFISSMRRLFSPKTIRHNSQLVLGDMFQNKIAKERLKGADCVMIFGVKSLMPKIADLVQRECQQGSCLMSYRFRVPLLVDVKDAQKTNSDANRGKDVSVNDSLGGINASLIYDEEEMRIYELNDEKKL